MGRMLQAVTTGKVEAPLRDLVYGVEGCGKTTYAADAPKPIFLGEDGSKRLNVNRFPVVTDWQQVPAAIHELIVEPHRYETLVLDTLDHLEVLLWKDLCRKAECASIEDIGGGYGKGYTAALEHWRDILSKLTELQTKRGMHIILIAHAQPEKYSPPGGPEYERFGLKLNKKASSLIKGWTESVLFAAYRDTVNVKKGRLVGQAQNYDRLLYTTRTPAADAKNRYGLPPTIELDFARFWALIHRDESVRIAEIKAQCLRLIDDVRDEVTRTQAAQALQAQSNMGALQRYLGRLTTILATQDEHDQERARGTQQEMAYSQPSPSHTTPPAEAPPPTTPPSPPPAAVSSAPTAPTAPTTSPAQAAATVFAQAPLNPTTVHEAVHAAAAATPAPVDKFASAAFAAGWPPVFVEKIAKMTDVEPISKEAKAELMALVNEHFAGDKKRFGEAWLAVGFVPAGADGPQPTGAHVRAFVSGINLNSSKKTA